MSEQLLLSLLQKMEARDAETQQQMQLLSQAIQKLSITSPLSTEKQIDTIARNIIDFHHDPDTGNTFDQWYKRYTDSFDGVITGLSEPDLIRLLLMKLSPAVYRSFDDYIMPKKPGEMTLAENVEVLTKLFGNKKSIFSIRFECLNLEKLPSDDYYVYAGKVNNMTEQSEWSKMNKDDLKCLFFILGLRDSSDTELRLRLLTLMDRNSEASKKTSIDDLVKEIGRIKCLLNDTKLVEVQQPIAPTINAISSDVSSKKPWTKRPCRHCGGPHYDNKCTFRENKCKTCGKFGHKDGYCNLIRPNRQNANEQQSSFKQNSVRQVNSVVEMSTGRKYVTCEIDNKRVTFQHDDGADFTIIDFDTWKGLGSPELKPSQRQASSVSNHNIPFLGEFRARLKLVSTGQEGIGVVTVMKSPGLNLFGLDFHNMFGLDQVPLSSVINLVSEIDTNQFLVSLQEQFKQVFTNNIGHCNKFQLHVYRKPDPKNVYLPARPIAQSKEQKVKVELDRLESSGIITRVQFSPNACPMIAVERSDGRIRIVGDYTVLNQQLESYPYPVKKPEDLFMKLNGCKHFSKIDLSDAYMQFEVDDESKTLLAINTPFGLYASNRLTPGIKPAAGAFQEAMDRILNGIPGVESYFDDIMISTKTIDEHVKALETVCSRFEEYGLTVNANKCEFFKSKIGYLGHIVDGDAIFPDPSKVSAIVNLKAPQNVSELRSFLGSINYYSKFIPSMKDVRAPMDRLLKKGVTFEWNDECESKFNEFKKLLTSDLMLIHYDPELPVILAADASSVGVGATLQHVMPNGQVKAIAHAARSLTPAEQGYAQIEKEGLAIIYGVKKFHKYVFGRHFTLQTDNKPLMGIYRPDKSIPAHSASRLQRWALILASYDFELQCVPTAEFGYADVLSRLIDETKVPDEEYVVASVQLDQELKIAITSQLNKLPVTFDIVKHHTVNDSILQEVLQTIKQGWPSRPKQVPERLKAYWGRKDTLSEINGVLMSEDRVVIPESLRKQILMVLHDGHICADKMKAIARSSVYWPRMNENIEEFVRICLPCATVAKSPVKSVLKSWPKADKPMQRIHMDLAGKFLDNFYLIVVDSYSKWPEMFVIDNISSSTIIGCLHEVFSRFGDPDEIVTDNGTQFTSSVFNEFCAERGIRHMTSPEYHPQSNGQAERFVDTMKRALKKLKGEGSTRMNLLKFLRYYRHAPNPNCPNGVSPAEAFIGRKINTEIELVRPRPDRTNIRDEKMEEQFNRKNGAKNRTFNPNDSVYAKYYKNNSWQWIPAEIIERQSTVIYICSFCKPNGQLSLMRRHVNQLRPRYDDNFSTTYDDQDLMALLNTFDMTPTQEVSHTPVTSTPTHSEASSPETQPNIDQNPTVNQRPRRETRPPARFADYHLY